MAQKSTLVKLYCADNGVSDVDFTTDVLLQDDGQGAYIKEWNVSGVAKPSDADLASFETAGNTQESNAVQISKRVAEYGSPAEQIANIIENGLTAEQTRVNSIKTKYPKS